MYVQEDLSMELKRINCHLVFCLLLYQFSLRDDDDEAVEEDS